MQVSGIILAGGRSSRLGRDKTLLTINNETLIKRTIRVLSEVADEIIIASNHTAKYNLPGLIEVPDTFSGMGPMGGMHAGLIAAKHTHAFVVSCDMPFFSSELAKFLVDRKDGYDVIVPQINKRWEPLCGVYSKKCVGYIEKCLSTNVKQVYQFYPYVKVLKVTEDEISGMGKVEDLFYNLNTPADYNAVMQKTGTAEPGIV
jgi:molybdopterin-guanine dinucleotide biosynthesis protein A